MRYPHFEHEVIVRETPGWENDVCLLTDLTGNGLPDIIIGGKYGVDNLCWYEAPHWTCHTIGEAYLEAGGALVDINRNGRLDLVVGEAWGPQSGKPGGGHGLYWFEQPADPRQRWRQHVIEDGFHKYHDQVVGDVDGDGQPEILIASQIAGIVAYYDIPHDLRVVRWPYSARHIVADDISVEGLAIGDVDGDGVNEIIAGTCILSPPTDSAYRWSRRELADFDRPAVALGDLNGDGVLDLVAAEGELNEGCLAWFDLHGGHRHMLAEDLFHPHSLGLADFTGNGALDIFVGEMGLGIHESARLIIYVNSGRGHFVPVTISEGYATHNAQVADMNGNGRPDIVGKPYKPGRTVDIWWNTW
jgi:hypothetical protein